MGKILGELEQSFSKPVSGNVQFLSQELHGKIDSDTTKDNFALQHTNC